jgi:hypothetical protein
MSRFVSILAISVVSLVCSSPGAQAAFGVYDFDVAFSDLDGTPANQAGSHPFAFTTSLGVNFGDKDVEGKIRDLLLDLPPGLVGDTTAYPRCTLEEFEELDSGMNSCLLESVVGIVATSFDEPGKWITAPVFNLEPSDEAVMSLGFRVAGAENVVVDFGSSREPPYSPIALAADLPETVDLFGIKLQLWGAPASPDHDELRGICGVYSTTFPAGEIAEFEFEAESGALCPIPSAPRPFLTLPTSCNGPLVSFYEALSWEEDWDVGGSITHDGEGNPQGLAGCGKLSFGPVVSVQPTTDAAKSPTGLDLSISVNDEGLISANGLAQSRIRDIVLALPEGTTAGPAPVDDNGGCSEAAFAAETLEDSEGCPGSSAIGTVEVETPLLDEQVVGTVYRAVPRANFARSPMALYVVLKKPSLGILVKQVIAVERDLAADRLIVVANDMPQLPFSHLRLHLPQGPAGPLISPPRCDDYETATEIATWAGGSPFRLTSAFTLVSGPNGGPCPTAGDSDLPGEGGCGSCQAPAPLSSSSMPISTQPARRARPRHCPRGKRRVRRNGRTRCVKRRQGRHKESSGRIRDVRWAKPTP